MMTPADAQALTIIGVDFDAEVRNIRAAPNPDGARQRLAELKDRVRKAFRKAAIALHPDQNGGDEAKTAQFVSLCRAVEALCRVELRIMPPRPQPPVVYVHWVGGTCGTTTATSTAYAPAYTAWRVIHMRPF